jgi:3-hydroxyisobutyrate dehydrogenase-like beta-hydroxyacid dehydrogenase
VRTAFIGLGKMGLPMTARLVAAGQDVRVFNRSSAAIDDAVAGGAQAASSAADAEIVMKSLPTVQAVRTVYEALGAPARAGQVFVDHSTVDLRTSRWCAELLGAAGAAYLDAPVSGEPAGAVSGTLTVMVGGDATTLERARPALDSFSARITLCGPTGNGQAVKLINQLLVAIHTSASAEAAALATALGVEIEVVADVLGSSFGASAMLTRNLPRIANRDFTGATPIGLILRDLRLIDQESRRVSAHQEFGRLARDTFRRADTAGWTTDDMSSVVRLREQATGTTE